MTAGDWQVLLQGISMVIFVAFITTKVASKIRYARMVARHENDKTKQIHQ